MAHDRIHKLPRTFFERATDEVARDLLGKIVCRDWNRGRLAVRIVETEAYTDDAASHAHRGPTQRNAVMFGPAGYWYVYFVYGMHHCMNVVTEKKGVPGAVLIRAGEPLEGIELMAKHRKTTRHIMISNGPGKICQALCITRADSGADAISSHISIWDDGLRPVIGRSTRIGIRAAMSQKRRYFIKNHPFVSVHP